MDDFLDGQCELLPEHLTRAFANWPLISFALDALLQRAPNEGLVDDEAQIAYAARETANRWPVSMALREKIHRHADATLARIAARDARAVERATSEMLRMASRIGEFVTLCSTRPRLSPECAQARSSAFLTDVRALHLAWSALPERLGAQETAGTGGV